MKLIVIKAKGNSKKILSCLLEPPLATVPSLSILDKSFSFLSKISYISFRIFLRIIIGKARMDRLQCTKKMKTSFYINFSFYLFMYFYRIIRLLRIGNPTLIKIYAPNIITKFTVLLQKKIILI